MAKNLILEQNSISQRISSSYNNFLQDGNERIYNASTRLENLNDMWYHFEENHYKILNIANSDKSNYIKNNTFGSVEQNYLKNKCQFNEFIATHNPQNDNSHRSSRFATENNLEKLERIPIPKFNGSFTEWENFRDMFKSLVVDKNYSDVFKLYYLKSSLQGEALQLVNSYSITNNNFSFVWEKLIDKFENKRRLVNSHLASFFSLKSMKKESSSELKRILNGITAPIQALEALKRKTKFWDDMLVFHSISLFDLDTRKQWEKYVGNLKNSKEPPLFSDLIKFMESQVVVLESIEDNIKSNNNLSFPNNKFNKSSMSSNTNNKSSNNDNQIKCIICNKDDFFSFCDIFLNKTILERIRGY